MERMKWVMSKAAHLVRRRLLVLLDRRSQSSHSWEAGLTSLKWDSTLSRGCACCPLLLGIAENELGFSLGVE